MFLESNNFDLSKFIQLGKCLIIDVHFTYMYIYICLRLTVTTAFNCCSGTNYIAKNRLLAFGRFLYVGVFVFWEVRMTDKDVWLRFLLLFILWVYFIFVFRRGIIYKLM